ncbi:hypothetical protein D3C72_1200510 [compost metagenome]
MNGYRRPRARQLLQSSDGPFPRSLYPRRRHRRPHAGAAAGARTRACRARGAAGPCGQGRHPGVRAQRGVPHHARIAARLARHGPCHAGARDAGARRRRRPRAVQRRAPEGRGAGLDRRRARARAATGRRGALPAPDRRGGRARGRAAHGGVRRQGQRLARRAGRELRGHALPAARHCRAARGRAHARRHRAPVVQRPRRGVRPAAAGRRARQDAGAGVVGRPAARARAGRARRRRIQCRRE